MRHQRSQRPPKMSGCTAVAVAVAVAVALLAAASATSEAPSPSPAPTAPAPASTSASASANASAEEGLLHNRFAGENDGIHFSAAAEDLRPQEVLESQVHRDVSRGVAHLALGLDRELSRATAGSVTSGGSGTNHQDRSNNGVGGPATAADNIVFSPLSVAAALALLLLGSGGHTFNEVAQVLGVAGGAGSGAGAGAGAGPVSSPERDAAVHQHFGRLLQRLQRRAEATDSSEALAAHGVFVQRGLELRARYQRVATQAYAADVVPLDFEGAPFAAQSAVNAWVANKTRGRIRDIMTQPPPSSTRMALATALYFNGQWEHPFPRETTQKRPFYVDGDVAGETLHVDMMVNSADLLYANNTELRCQVLGMPYKGGDVVMYVALPHERGMAAVRELEARLTLASLERLVGGVRLERDVIVLLPRMKLDYSASLRGALERLGARTLFTAAANLSQLVEPSGGRAGPLQQQQQRAQSRDAMHFRQRRDAPGARAFQTQEEPLFVDDVLHKVEMEVTEMGTVASAATLATVTRGPHFTVRVDRPFLFFIRHEPTGLLLFWGTVVRPRPAPAIG